jgi:Zn-dependent metalloprotease
VNWKRWILAVWFVQAVCTVFALVPHPTQIHESASRVVTANPSENLLGNLAGLADPAGSLELVVVTADGEHVESLRGTLSAPIEGDLEAGAREFLRHYGALFNVPLKKSFIDMPLLSESSSEGGSHLVFGLRLQNVPVHGRQIDVHIGKDRRIHLVNGCFPTIESLTNDRQISFRDAEQAALRLLGAKGLRGEVTSEFVVLSEDRLAGRWAYLVEIPALEPLGDWEILIDAENGAEISRINQMAFLSRNQPNGQGAVYLHHPLKGIPVITYLFHLTTETLTGRFCAIVNSKGPTAVDPNNYHVYPPEDTHFDEVNVYFHVTRIHDFFKALGFGKMDFPLKTHVHYGTNFDNAFYSPQTNIIAFGDGNRLNSLAREEAIIYHEYSHAVLDRVVKTAYKGESGAINEGQADYFASTLSNDPVMGEWAVAKMGKPWLRNLTDRLQYPKDIQGQVHQDGRIWGCVLWDIRLACGPQIADKLIHQSHHFLPSPNPTFLNGANAIFTADRNLFGGANKNQLAEVFRRRGIVSAPGRTVLSGEEARAAIRFLQVHAPR